MFILIVHMSAYGNCQCVREYFFSFVACHTIISGRGKLCSAGNTKVSEIQTVYLVFLLNEADGVLKVFWTENTYYFEYTGIIWFTTPYFLFALFYNDGKLKSGKYYQA